MWRDGEQCTSFLLSSYSELVVAVRLFVAGEQEFDIIICITLFDGGGLDGGC